MSARATSPNRILREPRVPVRVQYQIAEAVEREGGDIHDVRSLIAEWGQPVTDPLPIDPFPTDDGRQADEHPRRPCERRRRLPRRRGRTCR